MYRSDAYDIWIYIVFLCLWRKLSHITSHHITLHHITSHYITLHHITSHHITLHHITLHHITLHHITSHYITLHHITSHHITSHHITPHHITLITSHHITSHHITLHHITSHYITLHYTKQTIIHLVWSEFLDSVRILGWNFWIASEFLRQIRVVPLDKILGLHGWNRVRMFASSELFVLTEFWDCMHGCGSGQYSI